MYTNLIKQTQTSLPENKLSPEKLAQEILKIAKYSSTKNPVPIIEIAKEMGFVIKVAEELPDNDSGIIFISPKLNETIGSSKLILINEKIKYGKRRFVLAHEIGHYLYDFNNDIESTYINSYNSSQTSFEEEQRANEFAASLLMPKDHFIKKYKELKECKDSNLTDIIIKLSNIFSVTIKSVEKRISELGLI